jgi:hypothetical protein
VITSLKVAWDPLATSVSWMGTETTGISCVGVARA